MTSPSAEAVQIDGVSRCFGEVRALDNVSLSIQQGEFFSLLGPSGCGKTTLLRIIAGLETLDSGRVSIAGLDTTGVPAHKRPVNTVFQSYALFPHMTVAENIAFGLKMKKTARALISEKVGAVMKMVEIENLGSRWPRQLSGGQKQRVALARAIVNEPKVLLLDEPLAALDLKLRKQLQLELLRLKQRLDITFIYVTHDQEEALVLSDRLAVMRNGKIEQLGRARELYDRPRTRFASQFLGSCSLIRGKLKTRFRDGILAETSLGDLRIAGAHPPGEQFTAAIRPEKIELLSVPPADLENTFRARVEQMIYAGSETHFELRAGAERLRAEIMNVQNGFSPFAPGREAWVRLPAEAVVVLDD